MNKLVAMLVVIVWEALDDLDGLWQFMDSEGQIFRHFWPKDPFGDVLLSNGTRDAPNHPEICKCNVESNVEICYPLVNKHSYGKWQFIIVFP